MDDLEKIFANHGVTTLWIKHLPKKQDNEKNQVVLASAGAKNILTMFPATLDYRSASTSKKKRKSKAGQPKVEMALAFYWLSRDGEAHRAPQAKIINYFQYPEARFSGFMSGCRKYAPDALRRNHLHKYGKRILILGYNARRQTFGMVLTETEDPLVTNFPVFPPSRLVPILLEHGIGLPVGVSARDRLLQELAALCGEWHAALILKPGQVAPVPFRGNQGAGFTLEALLKIPANADKAPDKHGFEIKTFKKSGKISLMTPTADLGYEGKHTFKEFMQQHGWTSDKPDGRRVFNGIFRYRIKNERRPGHVYMLDIVGYEPETRSFADGGDKIFVSLKSLDNGELVSGWSLDKLLAGWNKKHANACYVEYEKRPYQGADKLHDAEYRYTGRVLICEGTSVWEYLSSIANNIVYYDPAHEIKNSKAHVRPQWRLSVTRRMRETLGSLYDSVTENQLTVGSDQA